MKGETIMSRSEYLESAFEAYNSGRISAEVYDAMIMNAENFCEDDADEEGLTMKKVHKAIAAVLAVIGFVIIMKAAGDSDLECITYKQLVSQSAIGVACIVPEYIILDKKLEEEE